MTQIWPPVVDPSTLSRQVWDVSTARRIPGVTRALAIYGMLAQCSLDQYRGVRPLPRSRFLERPDLDRGRPSFVRLQVEDYLLHGNAAHLVTALDSYGYPAAAKWYPAHAWQLTISPEGDRQWWLYGRKVPERFVIHVPRGADPAMPERGIGVVEQHLGTLDRVGLQDAAESANLRGRGMPGVAVIVPQKEPQETDLDAAADKWVEKFAGSEHKPAFLPAGTEVVPLAWSPNDQQMTEAKRLSLVDVANAFNLDGYWLGAPGSSHTYRSPGPMYLSLLRTSLEGVAVDFEEEWSFRWLPAGRRVRFDRNALLGDDLERTVRTLAQATQADLWTIEEARTHMGMDPDIRPDNGKAAAGPPVVEEPEEPEDELDEELEDEEQEEQA